MIKGPLIIYHGGCRDGFCAAWVANRALHARSPEFHAGYYGHPPPLDNAAGRDVYVLDFTYPLEQMAALAKSAKQLWIIDHHKTAEETLREFKAPGTFIEFDMTRSGAGMAWDHFFPGDLRPWPVSYVEDRDIWTKVLPNTEEVNSYLSMVPFTFEAWDELIDSKMSLCQEMEVIDRSQEPGESVIMMGRSIIAKVKQYIAEVSKNARPRTFLGCQCWCVNAPQVDISELGHHLASLPLDDGTPPAFFLGWWQRSDGIFQYSLRSIGDFDVSAIAKQFGGGGHKNAAGFQSERLLHMDG